MIYESAAITDYRQESGGCERHGEPLPGDQPTVAAPVRPGAKSIQQQGKAEPAQAEARPPGDHGGNGASVATGTASAGPSGEPAAALQRRRRAVARCPQAQAATASAAALAAEGSRAPERVAGEIERAACASGRQGGEASHPAVHEAAGARGAVVGQDQSGAKRFERCGPGSCSGQTADGASGAAPACEPSRKSRGPESAWGRVTTRIFGAGKT